MGILYWKRLTGVLLLMFIVFVGNAQIAFANGWNATTSVPNVTAAAAGSNRLLVYVITFEDDDNTNDVTSVSYGGQSMTQAVQSSTFSGTGSQSRVEIWYLNNAGITASTHTTFTPVFSISNPTTSHGYYTMAVTLSGVNQSTPVCTSGTGERLASTTVNLSSGISVLSSELVIYATHGGDARTHTPATGYTESVDLNGASGGQSSTVNSKSITTAGTENPTSTASGSQNRFVMAAVRIIPNAATCSSALPIELSAFSALIEPEGVRLVWETASETNNDYFTVERSLNGIDWEHINMVKGAGNSKEPLNYFVLDNMPPLGLSYYRLRQTDFDGGITYSWVNEVNYNQSHHSELWLYPNPARDEIVLNVSPTELAALQITDLFGANMHDLVQVKRVLENGVCLDISRLLRGTYIVSAGISYAKFAKL